LKTFYCDGCGNLVFFENVKCVNCSRALGFLPAAPDLFAFEPAENENWRPLASAQKGQLYHLCANGQKYEACNWMVAADDPNPFCLSCRLNELIPNLSNKNNLERWKKLEMAKRRILYTILRVGLPLEGSTGTEPLRLRFKFAEDIPGEPPLLTGHDNGLITINIAEADDVERERRRVNLHEPYRSLLGHMRHELAHYYWDLLIDKSDWLPGFRAMFGDESADYGEALKKYYEQGAPADWQSRHVTAYASAHPWEDWAETWAHYFHIMDVMETASDFGLALRPQHPSAKSMTSQPTDPFDSNASFEKILQNWYPITYALNSINRGMGLPDIYPFVLSAKVIGKLQFIHQVVNAERVKKNTRKGKVEANAQGARPVGETPPPAQKREISSAH
jgi:hypothetical protein